MNIKNIIGLLILWVGIGGCKGDSKCGNCCGRDVNAKILSHLGVDCKQVELIGDFKEYTCSTPNVHKGRNQVKGIVLHHTATSDILSSLRIMAGPNPKGKVSYHVIIDTDGSRYVLADPEAITWHAGFSRLNGRNNCNRFTVGIEFQGDTGKRPLTDAQIRSAIDYCLPIMKKYSLTESDIVTHQQIRDGYIKKYPNKKIPSKVDISDKEYKRFKKYLCKKHI